MIGRNKSSCKYKLNKLLTCPSRILCQDIHERKVNQVNGTRVGIIGIRFK